jgi:hypothetical protein
MRRISTIPGYVAVLLCFAIYSCDKPDILPETTERMPPKIQVLSLYPVVASNIDSLVLASEPAYRYENGELPYAKSWETEWTCTAKPDGAPDPVILAKSSWSAFATGLVPGVYVFQVSYRTESHTRKTALAPIKVVAAKPSGTVLVSDKVLWRPESAMDWNGPVYRLEGFWQSDADLFYYGGKMKYPLVEFLDPVSKQWKQLELVETGWGTPGVHGNASINFVNSTMSLTIFRGATEDFLKSVLADPPAVRLTYP